MALTFGPLYKDFYGDLKKRREDEAAAAAQGVKLAPVGSQQWQGPRVQSAPNQSIWDKTRNIFDSVTTNPLVRYNPVLNPAVVQTAAYDAVKGIKPIDQTGKTAQQQKAEWDAKFGKEVDPNNPNRSYQNPVNALKQMGTEGLSNIGVGMFSVASGNTAAPSAGELTKAEVDQIPGSRKVTDKRGSSVFVSPTNRPLTAQEEIINGINAKLAFTNPFGAKAAASLSNPILRTAAKMGTEGVQNVAANTLSNLVAPGTQSVVDRLKQSVEDAPMQFASGAPFGLLPNGGKAKVVTPSVKLRADVPTKPNAPDARPVVTGADVKPVVRPQVEAPTVRAAETPTPQVGKTDPKFERDINTGKMKMVSEPKPTVKTEKYSIANSDISRTISTGMNQDGFTVEDWGGKKRFVSLDGASTVTKVKVRKAEAEYEAAKKANNGTALAAKQRVNDAYSDAIQDLKLQDYATTESGGRTFNSRYNDWLETKYKDRNIDTATIKDMAANPQKYRSQFEAETSTAPQVGKTPPTKAVADAVDPLESLKQEAKPATGARSDYSPENLQANRQIRAKNASSITYADKKTINPDELVTVYRAVPGKAKGGLVEGDWVTPNKEQARLFMKQSWAQDDTGAKIVTKKVKASELRYHADDAKGYVDDELLYVPKATQSQPPIAPQVGKITPNNQRAIGSYSTPKSVTEYKVGERVSNATSQGGTIDGTIVKTPDFTKDLRFKGNDFTIKLDDGTTIKTSGAGFDTPVAQIGKTAKPKVTAKGKTNVEAELEKFYGRGGDQEFMSGLIKKYEPQLNGKNTVLDLMDKAERKRYESIANPKSQAPQASKTVTKPKVAAKAAPETLPEAPTVAPATTRSVDEILYGNQPKVAERGRSIVQTLSPDRLIREKITNPLEEAASRVVQRMQTSKSPISRAIAKPLAGVSREAGVTKEVLQAKRYMRGGIEKGKLNREAISELGDGFSRESRERVWATLDPEQAQKIGLEVPSASQLTPEEIQLQSTLKEIIDSTTEGNLRRGLITVEQADKGDYLKRGYSVFEGDAANNKAYKATRKNLLDQYRGRKEITDDLVDEAITDPVYLVAKKQAESEAAWAMHDYGSFIVEKGMASPTKRPGYRQLPNNPLYGPAAGQYVPINIAEDFTGFSYDTGIINAYNDLITAYDSLGIRRAKKELLTVFNPAVRAGNQFSNRAVFANMNGINPVQFQKNYLEAGKQIKAKGQYYREALEQGLTGIDVTQADFHARVAQYADDPNIAQKSLDWTKRSYSAADDKARVAAYITWRKRGLSAEEAGRKVQRGFQDYKSVGFFYDMAAKTPLIGNAFVRFAGDAIRIAKNSALDHPLRTAATIMLWSTFVDAMSKFSGESEQDKQTREDRFGAPKIPFTDISMTVQTPMGEINVARFLPFYQLNEIQGPLARFLPIQADPTKPEGWQDPLLGQFAQLAADKDFRGKSIKDPENTGQFSEPLPQGQELANQARFLATQNLPLGREADSIISAVTGQPDIYGKERTPGQALLRAGGIKVEQFGPEQAAKQRSKNQYFDEKAKIDEQLSKMSPAEQEAYKRLTGYYKLREKVPNEFEAGAMRYKKTPVFAFPEDKWKDYTANPNIYSFMEQKKNEEAKRGVPLQPEFDKRLSLEFRKQLINNKSLAPGEDVEADERMYSNPEWDKYQQIKKEYTEKAKKYYPEKDGEFVDELVKHKTAEFPQKPAAKVAYDTAYANYVAGKGAKPAFTDAVAQAKEEYTKAKLDWTNNERKARELPPINPDVWNNVTFGFESDEEKVYKQLKYGKGYGGYGKSGSKVSMKAPETYGTELRTGATIKKPTVKKIAMPSSKRKTVAIAKPKVSMKKSKV